MLLGRIKKIVFLLKRNVSVKAKENQLNIKNQTINYLKIGEGSRTVLCLPGVLGTMWTDFPNQIQHLNKTQLTVVCMDMPGCGGSRPPNRSFPSDFYRKDAVSAANLMKELNVDNYSLMGWSDGGISALILASQYPENVSSLVVWGANSYVSSKDIELYQGIRDTDKWSPRMLEPFLAIYDRDVLKKAMGEWVDTLEKIEKEGGDLCKKDLPNIRAPTLIVHGDKDPLVPLQHAEFLKENIPNSKLVRFPNGKHNLHLRYYKEFNDLVEKFISEH